MKHFLKSAAALGLAAILALSVTAANPNAGDVILEAAAQPVEFIQAEYPTTDSIAKLDIEGITNVRVGKEAEADTVADIGNMVDENAATYGTITVKDGVATLYFQVGGLCNPKRLLVSGIEDDYFLTLSASPDNQCWYDVHVKALSDEDGSRVYEVSTKRDYQYFQVDFITDAGTLTINTLAVTGKMIGTEMEVPVKPAVDAAVDTPDNQVVKDAAAEDAPAVPVAKPVEDAAVDAAAETAEPLVEAAAAEKKPTASYTYQMRLARAVR